MPSALSGHVFALHQRPPAPDKAYSDSKQIAALSLNKLVSYYHLMLNTAQMIDIADILTSGIDDAENFQSMANVASSYLLMHKWCGSVIQGFLERGLAGVIAVFYFHIEPIGENVDNTVWVIVGDIPAAYMDTESCATGMDALDAYVYCLQEWIDHVQANQSVDQLMPICFADSPRPLEPTPEHADMLHSRVLTLREEILPWLADWSPYEEYDEASEEEIIHEANYQE